ncbi:MAG: hypothetical protein JNL11_16680 [Bdellovibrionaceae bacterium]|nr:hypothetical protein [Pseudobdellovibrionaceae bacterium]
MQSSRQHYKLPVQTKIVFTFILVLTVSLVFKWGYYAFFNINKASQIEQKFSGIKLQVNDICLNEEKKSVKVTSESTEEDLDWVHFRAPEYCRCVSSRLISHWGEKDKLEQINQFKTQILSEFIVTELKGEESKIFVDFCLSKAQKSSGRKITASAVKN